MWSEEFKAAILPCQMGYHWALAMIKRINSLVPVYQMRDMFIFVCEKYMYVEIYSGKVLLLYKHNFDW